MPVFVFLQQINHRQGAEGIEASAFYLYKTPCDILIRGKRNIAGRVEVSLAGIIGACAEIDVVHRFRDDEMRIRVALSVCMAHHVHRHAVDRYLYIGAMIHIESAEKDLLCLTAAGVLGDEQSGYKPQEFLGILYRADIEVDLTERTEA